MTLTFIQTPIRRYTFQSLKIKKWVESKVTGDVLNLFAGKVKLNCDETRNDIDPNMISEYHKDALDFVVDCKNAFDVVILDPPYSYRKGMELYRGNYVSKFRRLADEMPRIVKDLGCVISFGYHTTFIGERRGFKLEELCIFGHSGAQHATIAIIERKMR